MQPRHAHVQFSCELLDGNWLVEVLAESLDGSGDGGSIAPLKSQVTEPATLLSHQKSIDNFPRDQRPEDPSFGRGIQEPGEPHAGIQQVSIQRADVDGPDIRRISRLGVTGLKHDRTDKGGGKFQAQAEEGPLLRGFQDLTDVGQIDRHQQIVERVVPVVALAQQELLAPLGNHAHRWLDQAVHLLQREGVAVQVQPWQRLGAPILDRVGRWRGTIAGPFPSASLRTGLDTFASSGSPDEVLVLHWKKERTYA
jgi:hypothetical protein